MPKTPKEMIRKIEFGLRHYRTYKVAISNLEKQLNGILPDITTNYELREGVTGVFVITSSTERCAIDRIESKRALDLHEQIKNYKIIVDSIDDALKELKELERKFVNLRYINGWSVNKTALAMGYTDKNLFVIRKQSLAKLAISLGGLVDFF